MSQPSATMRIMMKAVQKVGQVLIRDFGEVENLQVSLKGPGDFVSSADMKAEKILIEELSRARPNYGFLTEEGDEIEAKDNEHRWIIDPIDGTTNFLHGFPHFCIAVGLEKKLPTGKSEIIAGIIYDPYNKELYYAEKGMGAWLERWGHGANRLRVGARKKLSDTLVGIGSFRRADEDYKAKIKAISGKIAGIRDIGSIALSMAYVASGRYDAFFQSGGEAWDMAAGIIIVREAGGFVTDFDQSGDMLTKRNIVAANDALHAAIMKEIS